MNTLTTKENGDILASQLKQIFPFANVVRYTLGGEEQASLGFAVSLQPKDEWKNHIFENSNGAKFMLNSDGSLYMLTRNDRTMPKFRKTKVKDINQALAKINQWKDTPVSDAPQP